MTAVVATFEVRQEEDVVLTRQRVRDVAAAVGFDGQDQTRVATAVSELARTALANAGGGRIDLSVEGEEGQFLVARIEERGRGRHELAAVLDGRAGSVEDTGFGLVAARRLMDRFQIEPGGGGGSAVRVAKALPRHAAALTAREIARIAADLAGRKPEGPFAELRRQNQELLQALAELRERQAELAQLNCELDETNRGVVALYAELDEKADSLRRASELKSRFLSNMSHEFRSPLNSILSLSRFLLDRTDGDLTVEQEKQVGFIAQAADGLLGLVNDLLDLAKVEAGKVVVYAEPFDVADLFRTLRGMFRPLVAADAVSLVFEEPAGGLPLDTDEGKVSQILRNFLSNAVKFTERGEIRVSCESGPDGRVTFAVSDTGIGIAAEDSERVFEEFAQVEGPAQRRIKGTGLGLPLSRKLAELLGGSVSVRSEPGAGSTFSVTVPRVYAGVDRPADPEAARRPHRRGVLLVEDDPATRYLYERHLEGSEFRLVTASSVTDARQALRAMRPDAVVLDILFEGESGWDLLAELKGEEATRGIPVLVLTIIDDEARASALGADDFCLKPVDRNCLLEKLVSLTRGRKETALIVDDDETARYLLRSLLLEAGLDVAEASGGSEGVRRARAERPRVVFLDLSMPETSGYEVLQILKADDRTRAIPVVIHTSQVLDPAAKARLAGAAAILSKEGASRDAALSRLREVLGRLGLVPPAERSA